MKWESFPITLTPLSPLHIGDGSQLEAYEYAVVKERFYRISLDRLLTRLSAAERETLNRYIEHDLVGLRKFVREHFSPEVAEYQAAASPRFREVYEEKLGQAQNQLIVFPFLRSVGKPLIPGSSLKGALRTAILNQLITAPISSQEYADTLEARTLGYMGEKRPDIPNDPLKGLRVSDVSLSPEHIVAEQVETKKKEGGRLEDLSLQILREVTVSVVTGQEISLSGEIRIYEGFLNRQTEPLKQGLRWLAEACNTFYRDQVLAAEERYFRGLKAVESVYQGIRAAITQDSFLVRLGWGSGLDSVSLNLQKQSPRPVKTRKLIDGRIPMGWLRVECKVQS
jgi:CRISPR-associated protein Csm5